MNRKRRNIGWRLAVAGGVLLLLLGGLWLAVPREPRRVNVERLTSLPEHTDPWTVAAFNPAGKWLAASDFKHLQRVPTEVAVWNLEGPPSRVATFDGPETQCHALRFHPNGSLLAIAGEGGQVRIVDVVRQEVVRKLEVRGSVPPSFESIPDLGPNIDIRQVRALAFSPAGDLLAVATNRRTVEIWSTRDWTRLHILPPHSDEVNDLAFSPDGSRMLSAGGRWESIPGTPGMRRRPELFAWNTTTWKKTGAFEPESLTSFLRHVIFASNSLAVAGDARGNLAAFNPRSGQFVAKLEGHDNGISGLAYDASRNLLVSASAETILVWDMDRFLPAATVPGSGLLAYAPSTGRLVTTVFQKERTLVLFRITLPAN